MDTTAELDAQSFSPPHDQLEANYFGLFPDPSMDDGHQSEDALSGRMAWDDQKGLLWLEDEAGMVAKSQSLVDYDVDSHQSSNGLETMQEGVSDPFMQDFNLNNASTPQIFTPSSQINEADFQREPAYRTRSKTAGADPLSIVPRQLEGIKNFYAPKELCIFCKPNRRDSIRQFVLVDKRTLDVPGPCSEHSHDWLEINAGFKKHWPVIVDWDLFKLRITEYSDVVSDILTQNIEPLVKENMKRQTLTEQFHNFDHCYPG
ncbi:hypothetical protein BT69DRAFT_154577 [Atractiella rhizophila]|nr:hypothetical protein BT69DRAFT_154577 [Atractiella rhizophila]